MQYSESEEAGLEVVMVRINWKFQTSLVGNRGTFLDALSRCITIISDEHANKCRQPYYCMGISHASELGCRRLRGGSLPPAGSAV